jgi:hypothetical protein
LTRPLALTGTLAQPLTRSLSLSRSLAGISAETLGRLVRTQRLRGPVDLRGAVRAVEVVLLVPSGRLATRERRRRGRARLAGGAGLALLAGEPGWRRRRTGLARLPRLTRLTLQSGRRRRRALLIPGAGTAGTARTP